MDENEIKKNDNNNISVPKPLFALLIIVLCAAVCYSAYNAGYMKGISKAQAFPGAPEAAVPEAKADPAPQPAPEGGSDGGMDYGDFFRDIMPFHQDGQGEPGGGEGAKENEDAGPKQAQGAFLDIVAGTVSDEAKESYNLPAGVLIMKVSKDGAAEKAGIKEHSVITECDGKTVAGMEDLKAILSNKAPGDVVEITLYEPTEEHGFEKKTINVTLSDGEAVSKER